MNLSSFLYEFNPFAPFSTKDTDISTNWNGLYLNNPLIVGQNQSVTFQGITYQFEKNDKFVGGTDRYKNEIRNILAVSMGMHQGISYENTFARALLIFLKLIQNGSKLSNLIKLE